MTRLRGRRSVSAPKMGAEMATPSVAAETVMPDAGFGGMEEARQHGQQRLRAVELKKGADAAQRHRGGSPVGGRGTFLRWSIQ